MINESDGTRQEEFRARLLEVLAAMEDMMPEMSVTVELWRADVVDHSGYADEQTEVWVRLDENVPGFNFQTPDRWFEQGVGIVRVNYDWLILPDGLGVKTDDHVVFNGESYLISEATEMAGIFKCKIDKRKSRFVQPARALPTYRQMSMKACIV